VQPQENEELETIAIPAQIPVPSFLEMCDPPADRLVEWGTGLPVFEFADGGSYRLITGLSPREFV